MRNLPIDWKLVESYDGNFIFENSNAEFSVSIDKMGAFIPPYEINYQQLKGTLVKIGFEDGAYSTHAQDQNEAIKKACDMMNFINKSCKSIKKI